MKFCELCNNMLYLTINEEVENQLNYSCRNCGFSELVKGVVSLSTTTQSKCRRSVHDIINKYTKLDPTLPRVNTVHCANEMCETNQETTANEVQQNPIEREIIYIRYDDADMKYIYMCCHCDSVWSTDNKLLK